MKGGIQSSFSLVCALLHLYSQFQQIGPQVRVSLTQRYKIHDSLGGSHLRLPAVLILTFNQDRQIVRHEDRWWNKDTTMDGPLIGFMHYNIKALNGRLWKSWGEYYYPGF